MAVHVGLCETCFGIRSCFNVDMAHPLTLQWREFGEWLDSVSTLTAVILLAAIAAVVALVALVVILLRRRRMKVTVTSTRTFETGSDAVPAQLTAPADSVGEAEAAPQAWQQAVVGVAHEQLFDAQPAIDRLVELVQAPAAGWAATVSGPGGIGKTAITYEAISKAAQLGWYSRILWVSGRTKDFGEGEDTENQLIDWEDVVFKIGTQLECDLRQRRLWEREVTRRIIGLGPEEPMLLVVDNLEGVHDADRLLDRLARIGIGHPHRVILASRRRLQNTGIGIPNLTVAHMRRPTALAFMQHLGRNSEEMKHASARSLEPIYTATDGNPFLIKLIVSRYLNSVHSLEEIIGDLQTNQEGRLGARVRHWLFEQSLDELAAQADAQSAAQLIGAFCFFPRGESVPRDRLQEHSLIKDDATFMHLLETARRLELVRRTKGKPEFSIHSLLYEFTRSELGADR
jgi:hypothetical protein